MKIFSKIPETTSYIRQQIDNGKTIGFVPTMGALHEGHLALMRRARQENDLLVVSIFVNPIQFNNKSDLDNYPRVFDEDVKLLKEINTDILFAPSTTEMYPVEVKKQYDFGALGNVMEGANRPGHFNGVAIVVSKLFDITIPHRAYFGEKDFQQLAIINKLVKLENINVEIIPCEIVREEDGLAMSSRNARLTVAQRKLAPFIYKVLKNAGKYVGNKSVIELKKWVKNQFKDRDEFCLEYFEISDSVDLQSITDWNQANTAMGFIVVKMGNIRLIDNIRLFNNFAASNGGN